MAAAIAGCDKEPQRKDYDPQGDFLRLPNSNIYKVTRKPTGEITSLQPTGEITSLQGVGYQNDAFCFYVPGNEDQCDTAWNIPIDEETARLAGDYIRVRADLEFKLDKARFDARQ